MLPPILVASGVPELAANARFEEINREMVEAESGTMMLPMSKTLG